MNIGEKITEINKQPQHIRMRWVWGSVTVSMLIILVIWIFSLIAMFKNDPIQKSNLTSLPKQQVQESDKKTLTQQNYSALKQGDTQSISDIQQEGVQSTDTASATTVSTDSNTGSDSSQQPTSTAYDPQ